MRSCSVQGLNWVFFIPYPEQGCFWRLVLFTVANCRRSYSSTGDVLKKCPVEDKIL